MGWQNVSRDLKGHSFRCHFCWRYVQSKEGYVKLSPTTGHVVIRIYICSHCYAPNYIDAKRDVHVVPKIPFEPIEIDDQKVKELFTEVQKCLHMESYIATAMLCRKILMNVAVSEKAEENKNYTDYVDYIKKNNLVSRNSRPVLEEIRKIGNEANHKIEPVTKEQAHQIFMFVKTLLHQVYGVQEMQLKPNKPPQ